jgi:glyoxylase-like metal-dependent hydrolase (beta-lactamase superfamily II)
MRLILKILGGLLGLGLVVGAIALVPAHLQIRSVEPALPDEAALRALLDVEDGPVRLRYLNTSSQPMPVGVLGHTVFVAEWANGNLFVIDMGMDRETAIGFGELMESALGADAAVPHGNVAELLGRDIARVMGVAYTHLHIDHSQGTVPFCAARGPGASAFQTSFQKDLHNFNTTEAAEIVAESCLSSGQVSGDVVKTVDGFTGLGIVAMGGHTPGSTLFVIAVDNRLWLLSGDIANSKADLVNDVGKGVLYSYFLVPENVERTDVLRPWLTALDAQPDMTVIVSHDLPDIEASGLAAYPRPAEG